MVKISPYVAKALASIVLLTCHATEAKSVYAHYMKSDDISKIGTVTEGSGHAELDIDQAQALGIEAFAMNVGQPGQSWAQSTVKQLFDKADQTGFKLFFSLDFYQTGDVNAYTELVSNYINRESYLKAGPDNLPVISTFSVGGLGPQDFQTWIQNNYNGKVYFLPNADTSSGYDNPETWFGQWGNVVDGVFGWESAWPAPGQTPANVSDAVDTAVQNAAHAAGKTYMAPLSSLQFKKCCGGSYYRIGEANLPQRMSQLLALNPDFVEVLTWNDAGESHYIGNNWPEGLTEEILAYSNTDVWPHYDWQPLIASFISAYKAGRDASGMTPPAGSEAVGAMWYRPILKDASCQKPDNWQSAIDAVNYGIVVGADASGLTIRVTSGGEVIRETTAQPGLNYGSATGVKPGKQSVELVKDGNSILTAVSSVDVVETNQDCFFNFHIVGLK
ncbi:unnamed protein product [Clonostachys rhizophaga]|uniref:Glucan endo-1,3-alpha-glucosidase agn1 n=1 Tax=Clonostachys rhizophaga TaxID=160324 RepID=A0A9N9VA96_9HYPO|nr:unnamed protein product [Clonostachys rhizophaga]